VLDRIDVANDPVNAIDPEGLQSNYGPFARMMRYSPTLASEVRAFEKTAPKVATKAYIGTAAVSAAPIVVIGAVESAPLAATAAASATPYVYQYAPQATALVKFYNDYEGPQGPSYISRGIEILRDIYDKIKDKLSNNQCP